MDKISLILKLATFEYYENLITFSELSCCLL